MKKDIKKGIRSNFWLSALNYFLITVFVGVVTNCPIFPLHKHVKLIFICALLYIVTFGVYWYIKRPFVSDRARRKIKESKSIHNIAKWLNGKKRFAVNSVNYEHESKIKNIIRNLNIYNDTYNTVVNRSINNLNVGSKVYLLCQRKRSYVLMLPIKGGIFVFAGSKMSDLNLNRKTSYSRSSKAYKIRTDAHNELIFLKKKGIIKGRYFVKPCVFGSLSWALTFISQTPAARKSSKLKAISNSTNPNINKVMNILKSNEDV